MSPTVRFSDDPKEYFRQHNQEYYRSHYADPEWVKARNIRRQVLKFGLTVNGYADILASQNGGCAICGRPNSGAAHKKALSVDHDRRCCAGAKSCGACVRGLLCDPCNRAIGLLGDDPATLIRAAEYVRSKTAT